MPIYITVSRAGQTAPLIDAPIDGPSYTQADGNLEPRSLMAVSWDGDTGWVEPGYPGTSILVGHVDTKTGPNVFTNISEIQPGDKITIRYSGGKSVCFGSTGYKQEPKGSLKHDTAVYTPSNVPLLRLITCDNTTPFKNGHYEGNWAVLANQYLGMC